MPDLPAFTADQKAEDANWQTATRTNTVGGYRAYLNKSPNGTHRAEAERAILQLEAAQKGKELEKLLWDKARKQDTREAYEHYLSEYAQGTYAAQAEAALKGLHGRPQHGTVTAPPKKNTMPLVLGGVAAIAVIALIAWGLSGSSDDDAIAERTTAFAEAMVANDSATWSAFIITHPGTPEADSAQVLLDRLVAFDRAMRVNDSTAWAGFLADFPSTGYGTDIATARLDSIRVAQGNQPVSNQDDVDDPDVGTVEVKGHNVVQVNYHGGGFRGADRTNWVEENGTGTFDFVEVNHDEWSVYLLDPERQIIVQLDLYRKMVVQRDREMGDPHDLYEITGFNAAH